MITLGKKQGLTNYRRALSYLTKEDVAKKLFDEVAPKYAERNRWLHPRDPASDPAAVMQLKLQSRTGVIHLKNPAAIAAGFFLPCGGQASAAGRPGAAEFFSKYS